MNRKELAQCVLQASSELIFKKGYIAPVEIFMKIGMLSEADYERWRRRQVNYLENVLKGNLRQFSFVMSCLRRFAVERKLKPSWTGYKSWGRGKKACLRFSKSGDENIEKWYSTHFVKPSEADGLPMHKPGGLKDV